MQEFFYYFFHFYDFFIFLFFSATRVFPHRVSVWERKKLCERERGGKVEKKIFRAGMIRRRSGKVDFRVSISFLQWFYAVEIRFSCLHGYEGNLWKYFLAGRFLCNKLNVFIFKKSRGGNLCLVNIQEIFLESFLIKI